MGSHNVSCHPTQVNAPRLNPSQTSRYLIYLPGGMESWVDLVTLRTSNRLNDQTCIRIHACCQALNVAFRSATLPRWVAAKTSTQTSHQTTDHRHVWHEAYRLYRGPPMPADRLDLRIMPALVAALRDLCISPDPDHPHASTNRYAGKLPLRFFSVPRVNETSTFVIHKFTIIQTSVLTLWRATNAGYLLTHLLTWRTHIYYAAVLIDSSVLILPVRLPVCLFRGTLFRKPQIGANVCRGGSNRCANSHFKKKTKLRVKSQLSQVRLW